MPSYSALSFILVALAAVVYTLPVDEISARSGFASPSSGVGGQAGGGSMTNPVGAMLARNDFGSGFSGVGGQAGGGSVTAASNSCRNATLGGCGLSDVLDMSLVKLGSDNAGGGGNALSGASSGSAFSGTSRGSKLSGAPRGSKVLTALGGNSTSGRVPVGSGFSGAGGQAPGGSITNNHPGLIELDSDNAGQGGGASSGGSSGLVL